MPPTDANGCVVLACRDLAANQAFLESLGFRLRSVFPADDPRELGLAGHGLAVLLRRSERDGGGHLRLRGTAARTVTAPNGASIDFASDAPPPPEAPVAAAFAVHRGDTATWHTGRAGMLYRDLVPGRLDGHLIASHIRIARGGPVPDYVHFHRLAAQALFVLRGEVQVVYEDQGEPFWMRAGDGVLQPPTIRHRVLACSDGFEVLEVASPAEHLTCVDDELALPTARRFAMRTFGGQRFWLHRADDAIARPAPEQGFAEVDCGIAAASDGAIGVRTLRAATASADAVSTSDQLRVWFATNGTAVVNDQPLAAGDTAVLPPHARIALAAPAADFALVEFGLRADAPHA